MGCCKSKARRRCRGQKLLGAVSWLSQVLADFGLKARHPDTEVGGQRGRSCQNASGNGNQNQGVLHQILARFFLMELADQLCERHSNLLRRFEIVDTPVPTPRFWFRTPPYLFKDRKLRGDDS